MTNEETAVRATYFSIIGNTALALVKGAAGLLGNSYALVADANHPYGHGRIEPLVTFLVVGFLMTSATIIAYESIQNIGKPHALPKAWTLLVLGGIIVWKEVSYRLVMKKALETNSSSLKADAWHHRSDAIMSEAAFGGISVALFMGPGYEAADDWAALFAAGLIFYNSYPIFRPALGEILDENTHEDLVAEIRRVAQTVAGVRGTEKCFVRKAGMQYHVDLHATVSGDLTVRRGHEIAHQLQDTLRHELPQLANVLIHIEPQE